MARGRYLGDTLFDKMLQWKREDIARQQQLGQEADIKRQRKDAEIDQAIGALSQVAERQQAMETARQASTQKMQIASAKEAREVQKFDREMAFKEEQEGGKRKDEWNRRAEKGERFDLSAEREARQAAQGERRLDLTEKAFGLREKTAKQSRGKDVRSKESGIWNTTYDNLMKFNDFRVLFQLPADKQAAVRGMMAELPALQALAAQDPATANQQLAAVAAQHGLTLGDLGSIVSGGASAAEPQAQTEDEELLNSLMDEL